MNEPRVFKDYKEKKQRVFSLRNYIEMYNSKKVLTHIDAVPDNFLFVKTSNGKQIDYSLRNPQSIQKIDAYTLPTDEVIFS